MRLPELLCGFRRAPRASRRWPIPSPACPQAWAAGSVFLLLQACLGLRLDGWGGRVILKDPRLPRGVDRLGLCGLPLGEHLVDLTFVRRSDDAAEVTCSHPHALRVG